MSRFILVFLVAASVGCGASECVPVCDGRSCGPDECGGTCGACEAGRTCTAAGQCTAPIPTCEQTCADLGYACGEHCGESCGTCAEGFQCQDHACVCQPSCAFKACGDPDGCGGTCGPCPVATSCTECALRLHVLATDTQPDGTVAGATVAVEFAAPGDVMLPTAADLQLRVDGRATVSLVTLGPPLLDVGLHLTPDPWTGEAWSVLEPGLVRFLALSPLAHRPIVGGTWLTFALRFGEPGAPNTMPVSVRLIEREQTFAPWAADHVLWSDPLGAPVVIWPTESH